MSRFIITIMIALSTLGFSMELEWEYVAEDQYDRYCSLIETENGFQVMSINRVERIDYQEGLIWERDITLPLRDHARITTGRGIQTPDGNFIYVACLGVEDSLHRPIEQDIVIMKISRDGDCLIYYRHEDEELSAPAFGCIGPDGRLYLPVVKAEREFPYPESYYLQIYAINEDFQLQEDRFIQRPGNAARLTNALFDAQGNLYLTGIGRLPGEDLSQCISKRDENLNEVWREYYFEHYYEVLGVKPLNCGNILTFRSHFLHWLSSEGVSVDTFNYSYREDIHSGQFAVFEDDRVVAHTRLRNVAGYYRDPRQFAAMFTLHDINGDSLDGIRIHKDSINREDVFDLIVTRDGGFAVLYNKKVYTDYEEDDYTVHGAIMKFGSLGGSDIADSRQIIPSSIFLNPAYPNPFNSSTKFKYYLPRMMNVELAVYDLWGRKLKIIDVGTKQAGHHTLHWNADGVSSGNYIINLNTPVESKTRRATFIK